MFIYIILYFATNSINNFIKHIWFNKIIFKSFIKYNLNKHIQVQSFSEQKITILTNFCYSHLLTFSKAWKTTLLSYLIFLHPNTSQSLNSSLPSTSLSGVARCTQHYCWCTQHFKRMGENVLHLKYKTYTPNTIHAFRTFLFPALFGCFRDDVRASSPLGVISFPWRFICHALGGSLSALRTCNSVLLFHRWGKLRVSINGCVFVFLLCVRTDQHDL